MVLTEPEIQQVISQVKTAFPNLTDWQFNNEENDEYFGFSIWACYTLEPEKLRARRFFITFDTFDLTWRGYLSVGKPVYLWSSTEEGDAFLVDTAPCQTIDEAIRKLKAQITNLLNIFCTT
ncbi:MAG: hypothetical protein HY774_02415 [Acidobacteria bacterium]|nr:hypothetical protein [Acidobacteriota bacterium]